MMAGTVLALLAPAAGLLLILRWLRVAQREHYLAGSVTSIALVWAKSRPLNLILLVFAVTLSLAGFVSSWFAVASVAIMSAWPIGLGVRGRTSRLAWTPRLRRLGIVVVAAAVVAGIVASSFALSSLSLMLVVTPCLVDLSLLVINPVERLLSRRFVIHAQEKLRLIHPQVVAITGSYGKTSTKAYVAHMLRRYESVVASPASFNNILGVSRAINEHLRLGTSVFVAEMGTYGEGEIRELCRSFPPDISVIVTIGEAHLSRMGSRSTIVRAKSEITETSKVCVLNIDVPELDDLARRISSDKKVIKCSCDPFRKDANVIVEERGDEWIVSIDGAPTASLRGPDFGHPINLACAVGVALALGVHPQADDFAGELPVPPHRAERHSPEQSGVTVIDDTYNSNPVGAARAVLAAVAEASEESGSLFVVTPGMVELGAEQRERNEEFARLATGHSASNLVVVGWTNRRALESGARDKVRLMWFSNRDRATAALSNRVKAGDVILYENDLPDHYP